MKWLVGFLGANLGGWLGWWLGARFGLGVGLFLSLIGTAAGVYYARRLISEYLDFD
ncbi:MAG: hypothetical protein H0W69_05540 [Gemmatimonadaceae bacterium]|nr:hypothetical protein [Gemmatimonadaceae bacterium]